ncbi:hypothetical protein EFP55_11335 [Lacticaseibacillus paracasei]|nr:hypothetical protein [Lacticaseibacillus paracasei]MCT3370190.1 hypothetical protein [Lacticaseibacillus paracasei]
MTDTKREVFEYYLDMIKAIKDPLAPECVLEARKRYDAALPDDLPVIPKEIGEYIKNLWKYHRDLVDVFGMVRDLGITRTEPTGVLVWVTHNIDTFARAWLLGVWRVEENGEIVRLEAQHE